MSKQPLQTGDTQPIAAYDGNFLIDAYIATTDAALKRQPTEPPEVRRETFVRRILTAIGLGNLFSRQSG